MAYDPRDIHEHRPRRDEFGKIRRRRWGWKWDEPWWWLDETDDDENWDGLDEINDDERER